MKSTTLTALAATGAILFAGAASAETCGIDAETDPFDLGDAEVLALYDCMEAKMAEAYAKNEADTAKTYRSWAATATRPALQGAHSERFLNTFANDIAAETYLQFAPEGVEMPVGSILAKESFKVRAKGDKKGQAVVGPLFIMTKVGADEAPDADGWLYSAVQPNGKDMKISQSFCHDCHSAWSDQDSLAYPMEEVRLSAGN